MLVALVLFFKCLKYYEKQSDFILDNRGVCAIENPFFMHRLDFYRHCNLMPVKFFFPPFIFSDHFVKISQSGGEKYIQEEKLTKVNL